MSRMNWMTLGIKLTTLFATLALFVSPALAQPADDDLEGEDREGVEVLTRGPVHEAFAMPASSDPEAGLIAPKEPPAPIEEVPPEFRPEGDEVMWVPGYWAWDEDRDDFLWVSGIWRDPPPDHRWIPGYWNRVGEGWQWVAGFWQPDETDEVVYRETAPPESIEEGPTSAAPSEEHFWTPGSWVHYREDYRWRPGYWAPLQPDWIWVADRWMWTPRGYVFCAGHWDYLPARRGTVFAPIYFTQPVYRQPAFSYRPWLTISTPNLFVHWWARPNYSHYYFGDFYNARYVNRGFASCQSRYGRPRGWDPIIAYNQTFYRRQGIDYVNRLSVAHTYFANNATYRPPVNWHDQSRFIKQNNVQVNHVVNNIVNINKTTVINNINVDNSKNVVNANVVGLPINRVVRESQKLDKPDVRFAQVQKDQREREVNRQKQFREVNLVRLENEGKPKPIVDPAVPRDPEVLKPVLKLPKVDPPVARVKPEDRPRQPGKPRPGPNNTAGNQDDEDRPGRNPPGRDIPGRERPGREVAKPDVTKPGDDNVPDDAPKPGRNPPGRERPGRDVPKIGPKPGNDNMPDDVPKPGRNPMPDEDKPVIRPKPDRDPEIDPGFRPPANKTDERPKLPGRDPKPVIDPPPMVDPKPIVDPPAVGPKPKPDRPVIRPKPDVDRPGKTKGPLIGDDVRELPDRKPNVVTPKPDVPKPEVKEPVRKPVIDRPPQPPKVDRPPQVKEVKPREPVKKPEPPPRREPPQRPMPPPRAEQPKAVAPPRELPKRVEAPKAVAPRELPKRAEPPKVNVAPNVKGPDRAKIAAERAEKAKEAREAKQKK